MTDQRQEQDQGQDQGKKRDHEQGPVVYWSVLFERTLYGHAVDALLDIAVVNSSRNYRRISVPYMRTDQARNRISQSFLELSTNENDVLVMLDGDHVHPPGIVSRLASHNHDLGVVGALYFRRGEPYDPLFFRRVNGRLRNPAEWEPGMIYECDAVATGAIAIRRWVFDRLDHVGLGYPYFQYKYPANSDFSMTEDIFFAERCESAGISHYCDTSIKTTHIGMRFIGENDWNQYKDNNPDIVVSSDSFQSSMVQ